MQANDHEEGTDRLIHVMEETLANKIAAGEVVQRPASAAKELIENALDAGARSVSVVLKAAGSELIQVIDDGCGMSQDDALVAFRRHATSKIRAIEDLDRIHTLGFRGEALASIASVAQVELKTKRIGDIAGYRVCLEGGKVTVKEPCATPNGTSLAIRNLFYNVPARRNFLKTPATEFKHLVETFQFLALAHPAVSFRLDHDGNEVYRLTGAPTQNRKEALVHRISELFEKDYAEHLIPAEETTSYLTVEGVISHAEFHRRSRGEQFLFVNGRYVKHRSLEHAVYSAYEGLLPEGAYPFFALFLSLDPSHVDVNVHPTKAEVKFDDERGIYAFLKAVIKKALNTADLTPQLNLEPEARPGAIEASVAFAGMPARISPGRRIDIAPATSRVETGTPPRDDMPLRTTSKELSLGELSDRLYASPTPQEPRILASATMQDADVPVSDDEGSLLWQISERYILTQIRSGLMLVDQRAAHERILYERALAHMKGSVGMSQQLLFPHTLTFNPGDFELLKELLPDLQALGFDMEFFSGRSVVVRGVPPDVNTGDERAILDEVVQQYKSYQSDLQIRGRDNLAKSMAHRGAVRAGTKMSIKEMRTLIDQLFMCTMPYASPFGRPTLVKITTEELDKRFGRSPS